MKAWLRSVRGILGLALIGVIVALAVAVSRGQTIPRESSECGEPPPSWTTPGFSPGEPPMVEGPKSPQSPSVPASPFTLPPPKPLSSEPSIPFVPGVPSPFGVPVVPPEPIVRLRIRAPGRVVPGKEIEYRLTVENISRADAHHVLVRDRLPRGVQEAIRAEPKVTEQRPAKDGSTDLLWELGSLKAGDQKTITLVIKPTGSEDIDNRAYVQFEHGQRVTTRIVKPGVQVKVTVPTQAILYQSISFRIEVVNTGAVPLRDVVVTDELPEGLEFVEGKPAPKPEKPLTWRLGDLPPNQTRRIEYQVISKQNGIFRNKAKVTADGGASSTDSAAVSVVEPKLKITIGGPQRRLANRPIPYPITVRNLGTATLSNVQVADELPGDAEVLRVDANGRQEGRFVRWPLGTLGPGEQRPLLLVLRAAKTGRYSNQVTVKADNNLFDKASYGWTVVETARAPVIEIDKEKDSLRVGEKATYTIHLFNPGGTGISRPRMFVTVPDEMVVRNQRGPTTGRLQGQQIEFDELTVLDGGQEALYYVEVEAKKAGEAKLRAWWTDGRPGIAAPEVWEDTTTILENQRAAQARAP
jgi:uncharacterized repeat protein (TIGR01451 family)